MKKLGLLLVACFVFATISVAQNNIVKSLERNVPGQGRVTIHQDARIAALIGSEYVPAGSDEQKVIKSSGYRIQVYAGNNTRQAKNEAYAVATRIKEHFPELTVYTSSLVVPCRRFPQYRRSGCHDASVAGYRCIQGSLYCERADKYPFIKNIMLGKEEIVSPSLDELKEHYHRILTLLGEDAGREGLQKTPERVAKAMLSLTKGYHMDPHEVLRSAKFQEEYSQMVIVKDIDFFSLCEHHMLPFYGKAHVAYIPNGYITGLSKIARVVDIFSHRLQVQERMTLQIKECIQETLNPLGVMVVVEAKHMCMQMRGVEKQNSITTTSDFTGAFNQAKTREEFMNLIRHNS